MLLPRQKSKPSESSVTGFTIIELLVAVSITVVMVGLMLTVVTNVLNVWNRTTGDLSAENQARQVLDLITRDLQALVLRADGNIWLAATVQEAGGATGWTGEDVWGTESKPAGASSINLTSALGRGASDHFEEARFGQGGMWLRFFTNSRENANDPSAAPRAVAYQLVRRAVGTSTTFSYQLYRSVVSQQRTFDAGYNLFMAEAAGGASYNSAYGNEGYAGNIRRPPANFLLANNIIDFGVRFSLSDAGSTVLFPKNAGDRGFAATSLTSNPVPPVPTSGAPTVAQMRYGFPQVVDVFLRVLTPDGARQIDALERGLMTPPDGLSTAEYWWQLAEQNSQVFTRRVSVASRPL